MNKLEWTNKALKQLFKLPKAVQTAIVKALDTMLGEWPNARNIKMLTDRDDCRLRVGRYRVFFVVSASGEISIFKITEVKKRDERTY